MLATNGPGTRSRSSATAAAWRAKSHSSRPTPATTAKTKSALSHCIGAGRCGRRGGRLSAALGCAGLRRSGAAVIAQPQQRRTDKGREAQKPEEPQHGRVARGIAGAGAADVVEVPRDEVGAEQ